MLHANTCCCLALAIGLTMPAAMLLPNCANACSPAMPIDPYGIPLTGATNVPTATSLTIASTEHPWWVTLTANGVRVPVDGVDALGGNMIPYANYWRVRGTRILEPNTEYVLSMASSLSGEAFEVTRFTTGDGYDKERGTPPVLKDLELWRVRYPVEDIGAGGCVFSEYHSFAKLQYSPADIPDTPPEATLYRMQTYPKAGWAGQAIMFTGNDLFVGSAPEGSYPFPSWWPAALDPTTEHCFSITVWGYGDLSRTPLTSNVLCASVTDLVAVAPGTDESGADASEDIDSGIDLVAGEESNTEDLDTPSQPPDDTPESVEVPPEASSSGGDTGCSIGRIDSANTREGHVALVLMALALLLGSHQERRAKRAAQQTA